MIKLDFQCSNLMLEQEYVTKYYLNSYRDSNLQHINIKCKGSAVRPGPRFENFLGPFFFQNNAGPRPVRISWSARTNFSVRGSLIKWKHQTSLKQNFLRRVFKRKIYDPISYRINNRPIRKLLFANPTEQK